MYPTDYDSDDFFTPEWDFDPLDRDPVDLAPEGYLPEEIHGPDGDGDYTEGYDY